MKINIDKTAKPCVFCGHYPNRIHYETDLWYYECSNMHCDKHPKYAYMGFREASAKEQWDWSNRELIGLKRRKDNEKCDI